MAGLSKQCTNCKKIKPLKEFVNDPRRKDGKGSWCKKCQSDYRKKYQQKNRERLLNISKQWYENNKQYAIELNRIWAQENKEKSAMIKKKWSEKHKNKCKSAKLKCEYGITLEEYDAMFAVQKGVCAICHSPETRTNQFGITRLCVDHNHQTGKVRKLLCHRCNAMLGYAGENIDVLLAAIDYLRRN